MDRLLQIISSHKEFLGTATVVVGSMLVLWRLGNSDQVNPILQGMIIAVGILLIVPFSYCKIILKRPLSAIGFQKGNAWAGIGGSVLAIAAALAIFFVLWNFTSLLQEYRLPVAVEEQFLFFVLYEVILNGFIVFLFEVFFRGFIMLLWLRRLGIWSVFAQAAFIASLFYFGSDIGATTIPYLVFAPFAGLIAYQSRSIWYSCGASWFYFFLIDAIVLIFR